MAINENYNYQLYTATPAEPDLPPMLIHNLPPEAIPERNERQGELLERIAINQEYSDFNFRQAAARANFTILERLLEHGADKHSKDENDENAVFYAIKGFCAVKAQGRDVREHFEMMQHLVEHHKIDFNSSNKDGITPIEYARNNNAQELSGYLTFRNAVTYTNQRILESSRATHSSKETLLTLAKFGKIKTFDVLLSKGTSKEGDVFSKNALDEHGSNAVFYAISNDQIDMVRHLFERHGLNPLHKNRYNLSAQGFAKGLGKLEIADYIQGFKERHNEASASAVRQGRIENNPPISTPSR